MFQHYSEWRACVNPLSCRPSPYWRKSKKQTHTYTDTPTHTQMQLYLEADCMLTMIRGDYISDTFYYYSWANDNTCSYDSFTWDNKKYLSQLNFRLFKFCPFYIFFSLSVDYLIAWLFVIILSCCDMWYCRGVGAPFFPCSCCFFPTRDSIYIPLR